MRKKGFLGNRFPRSVFFSSYHRDSFIDETKLVETLQPNQVGKVTQIQNRRRWMLFFSLFRFCFEITHTCTMCERKGEKEREGNNSEIEFVCDAHVFRLYSLCTDTIYCFYICLVSLLLLPLFRFKHLCQTVVSFLLFK